MVLPHYPSPQFCLYGKAKMTSGLVRNSLMIIGDLPCDYRGIFTNFNPCVPKTCSPIFSIESSRFLGTLTTPLDSSSQSQNLAFQKIGVHSLLWTAFALIIHKTMFKTCYFTSMSKSWYFKVSIDINFLAEFHKLRGLKIHFSHMIFSGFHSYLYIIFTRRRTCTCYYSPMIQQFS